MPKLRLLDYDTTAQAVYEDQQSGALRERGPWMVDLWSPKTEGGPPRVVLQSDDFTHDVALEISGDFVDTAQKVRYAKLLADRMNRMPKE